MYNNQKVVVVMPAYNAELTIQKTHQEVLAQGIADLIIVVDDCSRDKTVKVASQLPMTLVHRHEKNLGYGGNQKSCYRLALENGADIVVMIHPDYQYTPLLLPAMATLIGNGLYSCVLGSRILGGYALAGGMPLWKYISNRALTLAQNVLIGAKLSEYHTGYRAFSAELLKSLPLDRFSNDFIFDNEMLARIIWDKWQIGEITCPTKYFPEASSINFKRSVQYGMGCLSVSSRFFLTNLRILRRSEFPIPRPTQMR